MTLNLPLLYVLWLEEYCQTSPNKNKSPNLWHITSILVCYIFVLCHVPFRDVDMVLVLFLQWMRSVLMSLKKKVVYCLYLEPVMNIHFFPKSAPAKPCRLSTTSADVYWFTDCNITNRFQQTFNERKNLDYLNFATSFNHCALKGDSVGSRDGIWKTTSKLLLRCLYVCMLVWYSRVLNITGFPNKSVCSWSFVFWNLFMWKKEMKAGFFFCL